MVEDTSILVQKAPQTYHFMGAMQQDVRSSDDPLGILTCLEADNRFSARSPSYPRLANHSRCNSFFPSLRFLLRFEEEEEEEKESRKEKVNI